MTQITHEITMGASPLNTEDNINEVLLTLSVMVQENWGTKNEVQLSSTVFAGFNYMKFCCFVEVF